MECDFMNADRNIRLEVTLTSRDETLIEEAISALGEVEVNRGRTARTLDPMTVLTIAGSVTSLVNGLLALHDRIVKDRPGTDVKVSNASGKKRALSDMTRESLEELVSES
jgi:hypothetical protein